MLKPTKLIPHPISIALASLAFSASLPAFAQGTALEEVIVTAEKREAGAQDTPISLVALSGESLDQRGITNTEDLLKNISGLGGNIAPGSRGATAISIRGVSSGNPGNISLDPAVGQYIDGVYVGKLAGSAMDVAEIERVELLRGPQGTLYGRNSTGGAINFITRKPTGEFGLRATGSLGNKDYVSGKLALDLPAVGTVGEGLGEFALSLGAQKRKRDPFYRNEAGGRGFDDLDREAYRLALRWTPSDDVTVDYNYDRSKLDENIALQQVVALNPLDAAGQVSRLQGLQGTLAAARKLAQNPGADPRISSRWIPSIEKTIAAYEARVNAGEGRASRGGADFSPVADTTVDGHSLTLSWDAGDMGALGDVTFKSITAYRELETYMFGDIEDIDSRLDSNGVGAMGDLVHLTLGQLYAPSFGYSYPLVDSVWQGIDELGAYHSKQDTTSKYEQFSQELQMVGATDRVDYALGLYYFDDQSNYDRHAVFSAPLAGTGSQSYELTTEAWAVFGQATWRPEILDDRLSLTAGLRYTEEKKEIDYDYSESASIFSYTPARAISNDENFYNTSGNITLAYQLSDEVNTFLRYATGYRSGGFNGEVFNNPFGEETIEQWELGIKSDWWDNRLRVNGSIYTYVYDDLQVSQIKTDESGATTSLISNAGKADRWGAELEITVAPIADMVAGLSYTYINGDYDEFPDTCGTAVPIQCISGKKDALRAASPANQLNAFVDYTFARTSIGEVTGFLQVNWTDEWAESALWTGVVNDQPHHYPHRMMDERTLLSGRLSLQQIPVGDGLMRVSLWGKNLLDDDYPTFSINFGALGIVTEQYGDPRTYGLEVSYEY
ncbi:TonB-dependent receptor [Parahaliea sp. F7430]|uniref:TonB-dependent receptor n=1 Tax=Sediminihaliea albiluteola TaxID=2758564 RepID=A0A7W2TU13_9GAMM|nr:TonB-dependent receptor [Sediminihaliea albiluteola]MBA6411972.1 TonB-dependent receptor [Sediminihaliea albiluteola]